MTIETFFRSTARQDFQNTKWLAVGKRKEERGKRKVKKVLSVTEHGFVFRAQGKPNTKLETYKAFQNRVTFLNQHMIV